MATSAPDYLTLERLRQHHPAWRLLKADQASLVCSFLNRVFIEPNTREITQSVLVEALEDELYSLREKIGGKSFPRPAVEYLNDWAANEKGWLRKFYKHGSDEPYFDLTPSTEKAITWLGSLEERTFIGTESRLLMLFDLLKQIVHGSEKDPQAKIAELERQRADIDNQIARITDGDTKTLDDTALRDRFQQFVAVARELLSDFRQVEHNFRMLDRSVRERVALWQGNKGELIGDILGERDEIAESDQGRSFQAFWDFLMSSSRQDQFTQLLNRALHLPAITIDKPDPRLGAIHYDWLEAGEHTQRMVAQLSQQLRRFLDDSAWLENRRIMEILRGIEAKALALRDNQPDGDVMEMDSDACNIELPMERVLYAPALRPKIRSSIDEADESTIDPSALFLLQTVDKEQLARHIRQSLQEASQITLAQLVDLRPLEHGLSELLVYLQLATDTFEAVVDEEASENVFWETDDGSGREAALPRVIFVR